MPNPQKPRSVNRLHGAKTYQRILSRQGEMIQKNKRYHCFQNSSISHKRTSQMIRPSPTTFEGGYTFYRNIAKWLVSKLGEGAIPLAGSHELMTFVTSLMTSLLIFHCLPEQTRWSVVTKTSNSEGLKSIMTGENLPTLVGLFLEKPHVRRTWFLS